MAWGWYPEFPRGHPDDGMEIYCPEENKVEVSSAQSREASVLQVRGADERRIYVVLWILSTQDPVL